MSLAERSASSADSSGSRPSDAADDRDPWIFRVTHGAWTDLRHTARLLWKNKGFAAVTLLTLALCIGANTAVFSMMYALMLKPLPFAEPHRIVEVYNTYAKAGLNKGASNPAQFTDYQNGVEAFESLTLTGPWDCMYDSDASGTRFRGLRATAGLFEVLKIQPLIGRFFTADNQRPGEDKLIVLTRSFWESYYREDPTVLDRTVQIDGETYTIIGVAPRAFEELDAQTKFIRPFAWDPARVSPNQRHSNGPQLFARLKPGATMAGALAQASTIETRFYESADPRMRDFIDRAGHKMAIGTVQNERVQTLRSTLYLLQGGVVFVLLIGCVNVANLLLARSNARQSELAIRAALGAGRVVIARQLLLESLLLTAIGAALGLALAWGAIQGINHFTSTLLPNMQPFAIDADMLAFTIGVALVVGLAIGFLPVVHVLGANLLELIHRNTRSASSGRGVRAVSGGLIVVQVAAALVLLSVAGLLIHSFAKAMAVDPGFNPRGVVTARVALPQTFRSEERQREFRERVVAALKEIPAVSAAAISSGVPFTGRLPVNAFTLRENTLAPDAAQPSAYRVAASPEYFDALGLTLLEGRVFEATDTNQSRRVFVVDERFAQKYFPGRSAIGGQFAFGNPPEKPEDWPEIIGVVRNVPHNGIENDTGIPFIYQSTGQQGSGGYTLFVRTARPAAEVVSLMREKIRAIDPMIAFFEADSLESVISGSFDRRRLVMLLAGAFAVIALLLSAIGLYGVLAYDVSQRTREIGIRGAIGASRGQVIGLILRQGLWKTGFGLVIGLVLAFVASRFMTTLLYQVKPTDPLAYVVVTLVLLAVAVFASYLPARRAARIDPLVALRSE